MKIDKTGQRFADTDSQRFFLGCWYNLCHDQSLDSDRVSILNPKNGLEELLDLYEFGDAYGGVEKRSIVASELIEILKNDLVLELQEFDLLKNEILSLLSNQNISTIENKKELIKSIAHELLDVIDKKYIHNGLILLRDNIVLDISEENSQETINKKTLSLSNSIMSSLLAFGSSLQEAAGYYRNILTKRNSSFDFLQRFEKMSSVATKAMEEYLVTFDLVSKPLSTLIQHVVGSKFEYGIFVVNNVNDSLSQASSTIKASSPMIAGQKALEILEELVDIVNYTLGKEKVIIKRRYCVRSENNKIKHFEIHRPVPNPHYLFNKSKFENFLHSLEALNISAHIETPYRNSQPPEAIANKKQAKRSNCKISAAFRLFRIGEASDNLEARFTSYWTSLESLTRDVFPNVVGDDKKVITAVVPSISANYVVKRLNAFLTALHNTNILEFSVGEETINLRSMSNSKFYLVLKNKSHADVLLEKLHGFPYFRSRLALFAEKCQQPDKMGLSIDKHEIKVSMQLKRLYRTRNVIIHQAGKVTNLELLCATLEHYLKICLNSMVDLMTQIPTIKSPEECFIRYEHLIRMAKIELNPILKATTGEKRKKLATKFGNDISYSDSTLQKVIVLHE